VVCLPVSQTRVAHRLMLALSFSGGGISSAECASIRDFERGNSCSKVGTPSEGIPHQRISTARKLIEKGR